MTVGFNRGGGVARTAPSSVELTKNEARERV